MASPQLTASVKQAFSKIPSYLQVPATYTLVQDSGSYDVTTDKRTETSTSISLILIRGKATSSSRPTSTFLNEDTPQLGETFICEQRYFGTNMPNIKGLIFIGTVQYVIARIETDAVQLTHSLTLERQNGASG